MILCIHFLFVQQLCSFNSSSLGSSLQPRILICCLSLCCLHLCHASLPVQLLVLSFLSFLLSHSSHQFLAFCCLLVWHASEPVSPINSTWAATYKQKWKICLLSCLIMGWKILRRHHRPHREGLKRYAINSHLVTSRCFELLPSLSPSHIDAHSNPKHFNFALSTARDHLVLMWH